MNKDTNNEKKKRDPDERVSHMNEIFDKYVLPLLGFTLAVFIVFGVIAPAVRSCGEKGQESAEPAGREYSSAEFYIRRSLLLDKLASNTDLFESGGYLLLDREQGGYIAYKQLEGGDEILENVVDPNGNIYSAVMSRDGYGKDKDKSNLTLMIYSGTLFLAIAEEEDGTYSALFKNESFSFETSDSDCRKLAEKVPASEWSRMLKEYRENLTPLLRD